MGLMKRSAEPIAPRDLVAAVSPDELIKNLTSEEAGTRRRAARDLASYPEAAKVLCERLGEEPALSVRQTILTSVIEIANEDVAAGLVPYLRSEDAGLRNAAVEALQEMPDVAGPYVRVLLSDGDSDVRIFAVDVLQSLCHADAPRWLADLLAREPHVNVAATAVDRLAEVGTPEMIPVLQAVAARFVGEPFIQFAVATAISRIEGGHYKN